MNRSLSTRSIWSIWGMQLILASAISFAAGMFLAPANQVVAEVQTAPTPDAFKSGGARSELVLKDMLDVIKNIDRRLEKFEQALTQAQRP